jgi:hypothetical protein
MDNGRKFLRYIVPAFVYLIEVILFLFPLFVLNNSISNFSPFWEDLINISHNVWGIIAGFIVSGGLGAFFVQIYHGLYSFDVLDFRNSIIDAVKGKYLKIIMRERELGIEEIERFNKRAFLMIESALWSQRSLINPEIKSATERTLAYHDHVHGLGGVIVATFFAFISWVLIVSSAESMTPADKTLCCSPLHFLAMLWIILIIYFLVVYYRLRKILEFHRYSILTDVLKNDLIWSKKPAEINIPCEKL